MLNANSIKNFLVTPQNNIIEILPTLASTNDYLKTKNLIDNSTIQICLAEAQTAGRGRGNNNWYSPANVNLYLSLLWPWQKSQQELSGLSLVIAIALVQALNPIIAPYTQIPLKIKWPNDIMWQQKKIAGILVEINNKQKAALPVIIGVGLNVNMTEESTDIDQPWSSLKNICGVTFDRNFLAAQIIKAISENLLQFAATGFAPFVNCWPQYDALLGQEIVVKSNGTIITGTELGIDTQGRILLRDVDGKIHASVSGEISKK